MIVTEPAPLMAIGGVDGNGLYGRQTLRGNLAYGGGPHEWIEVEEDGPRRRPSTPLLRNLARRVAELLPGRRRICASSAAGPGSSRTPPMVGRCSIAWRIPTTSPSPPCRGVGFGLSPASGHAVRDLVLEGRCTFADIDKLSLSRFAATPDRWREEKGWVATSHAEALALSGASAPG